MSHADRIKTFNEYVAEVSSNTSSSMLLCTVVFKAVPADLEERDDEKVTGNI